MSVTPDWTEAQIRAEREYRYAERLGILCGSEPPTSEQVAIARAEADAWEREIRGELNL